MKTFLPIFLLLFTYALPLSAQTDFRPAYLIFQNGDTVQGEVDYRGDQLMGQVCRFRASENSTEQLYRPFEIKGFRILDSKYYVSKELPTKKVFLEYLIKGKVSVYYYRDEIGEHYFLEKEGFPLAALPYQEKTLFKEGKQYSVQSEYHLDTLARYMNDDPNYEDKIVNVTKPDHRRLIRLAQSYHNSVCDEWECIVYKKQQFIRANLEVLGGVMSFGEFTQLGRGAYPASGVIAHIWLPRVNEKLFIKTGIVMALVEDREGNPSQLASVPVHLAYMLPSTYRVRPNISTSLIRPSYSAGVLIRLTERINIGAQGWIAFYPSAFLIPNFNRVQSSLFSANLYFEL